MHWRDHLDLAATVVQHAPALLDSPAPLPREGLHQYWSASKARFDDWALALSRFSAAAAADQARPAAWCYTRGIVQEVLAGETLTRVWGALLSAHDRRHDGDSAEPVARSVLVGQLEARQHALSLILTVAAAPLPDAVALNRLRSRVERWTDLLIGRLMLAHDVRDWALEPERAADFADELAYDRRQRGSELAWDVFMSSLRGALAQMGYEDSPSAAHNGRITAAVLGCFPAAVFDDVGLLRTAWFARLSVATADTAVLISQYLADDAREPRVPLPQVDPAVRRNPPRRG